MDYSETFSLVIKPATIYIILSLAISKDWLINQILMSKTSSCAVTSLSVSMPNNLQGLFFYCHLDFICRVNKYVYGLKHAPQTYFLGLLPSLLNSDFGVQN
jgi:hypothetical protein